MAEAEDLKSSQCGFDPHSGHYLCVNYRTQVFISQALELTMHTQMHTHCPKI